MAVERGARREAIGRVLAAQQPEELRDGVEANLRSLSVERQGFTNASPTTRTCSLMLGTAARDARLRPPDHRLGPRRAEGGDPGCEAGPPGGDRRAAAHGRRRLHEYRNDPVEDPPRSRSLPDRPEPARDLR